MSEVLILFVWSRSVPWSTEVARKVDTRMDKVAIRSICADSVEARSILASGKPRIEGLPAVIATERKQDGTRNTVVVYEQRQILELLGMFSPEILDKVQDEDDREDEYHLR